MKIIVSGALKSGKSSFIKYLDDNAVNIEAKGVDGEYYTVGMDMANLRIEGFKVFLFGTPGLLRFAVMRDVVVEGADGVLFLFDAADPSKDKEAISMLNSIRGLIGSDIPMVFVVNKTDLKDARPPEVVRAQNSLSKDVKVFATSAKTGKNVKEALKYVVNEVFDKHKELLAIMREYETDIKGLAERLNKNKSQMRTLLNNLELKHFIEINRLEKTYKLVSGLKNVI